MACGFIGFKTYKKTFVSMPDLEIYTDTKLVE